jgi:hypothetical protein
MTSLTTYSYQSPARSLPLQRYFGQPPDLTEQGHVPFARGRSEASLGLYLRSGVNGGRKIDILKAGELDASYNVEKR